jgi:hypothetical protein
MIDFDKEEFLSRLDIRLQTMASMLSYHEKWLVSNYLPNEKAKVYHKDIDKALETFNTYLKDADKKIQGHFEELREKYKNE